MKPCIGQVQGLRSSGNNRLFASPRAELGLYGLLFAGLN